MRVSVVGLRADGQHIRRTWLLTAPAMDGPEIPCMAAIGMVRKLASGKGAEPGARPCMGLLTLGEIQPQFERWGIRTEIREDAA